MIRRGIQEYFRLAPRASRLRSEVDEEIAFHIEERVARLMSRGYDREAARAEAERLFGPLAHARMTLQHTAQQRERTMSIGEWFSGLGQDLKYSARSLVKDPWVTLIIIATLALGIGANATMFGIVDQLLLRGPAHITSPEQVRRLYTTQELMDGPGTTSYFGYITYTQLRDRSRAFSNVAAYRSQKTRVGAGESATDEHVAYATSDIFPLLGVQPELGRFYGRDEDRPKSPARVVVIDHDYWKKHFGGSRDVIGRVVQIGGEDFRVIGVAPRRFTGPTLDPTAMWVPFANGYKPHPEWETTYNASWHEIIVRTKPGVTAEAAAAEATSIYRNAAHGKDEDAEKGTLSILPLYYGGHGRETAEVSVARWLAGVSLIVLLIACANVTNLLLSRAVRRRREISVRLAMGISRARLIRLVLSESVLLAVTSIAVALVLTYWGSALVRHALLPNIAWDTAINTRVFLFSLVTAIAAAIITGIAPIVLAYTQDLNATLRGTTAQGGGSQHKPVRDMLIVVQAALSLTLLIGAGLFVRSLYRATHTPLGIDAAHMISIWPELPATNDSTPEQADASRTRRDALLRDAVARLRTRPDVAGAALAMGNPFSGGLGVPIAVPGRDSLPRLPDGGPFITVAGPGYFETASTRILRGRGITEADGAGTPEVVVISETMADKLWPGEDALTKCILIFRKPGGFCTPVVGIAEDARRFGIKSEALMQYYVPLGQERGVGGTLIIVRSKGEPEALANTLRHDLFSILPGAVGFNIDLLQQKIDPQLRPWRLGATMFVLFGGLALLVAAIGLYSVIAYSVAQRRTELGIRMALGAQRSGIVRLILQHVVMLAVAGGLTGMLVAFVSGRFLQPLLFETSASDATIFTVVGALLLAIAIVAGLVPAARAGAVDPVVALRSEG